MIENSQRADEAQLRLRDKIVSFYSPEVAAFDVVPPLQYAGTQAYGKSFRRMFDGFRGPILNLIRRSIGRIVVGTPQPQGAETSTM